MVNVVDMPIKCPVAPLEFCFLADWYFHERGIRDRVELTYVTPLDGAFTKPVASQHLAGMLAEKGIELVTEFNTGEVDGAGGRLVGYDEREVAFDLAVVGPAARRRRLRRPLPGLGDELNFVPTDEHTLQAKAPPNVFVIGDAANVPASKAGSVTHFEGETLVENIARYLAGEPLEAGFDGHANCFIETGFHKALLIDFNYDTEPLPGHYPAAVGPPAAQGVAAQPPRQAAVPVVLLARPAPRPRHPGHRARHAHRRQARARTATRGGRPCPPPRSPPPTSSSTTRASSSTPSSGPRTWPPSSPAEKASTSSPTPTGRCSASCAPSTSPRAPARPCGCSARPRACSVKELYQLFPKGPAKIAARIAGIPKPRGCI